MLKLIIIILLLFIVCTIFYLYLKEKRKNKEIIVINEKIQQENKQIENENRQLLEKKEYIQTDISQKQHILDKIQESIQHSEQITKQAFEHYADILDTEYKVKEKEYNEALMLLDKSYTNIQNNVLAEINSVRADLDNISATRTAAIKAQLEEEKIQQQAEFYSLSIDDVDSREVKILHSIENELRDPRPIRMII